MAGVDSLLSFLDSSPSPVHAVESAAERLLSIGFGVAHHDEVDPTFFARSRGVIRRNGALVAWNWPDGADPSGGATIIGAHTDSPCLRLKPRPNSRAAGVSLLEVEIYGGALLNSWLDRDLGLAGTIHGLDGSARLINDRRPLARIPQLAIHLDREVNEKGLLLNRQNHMRPLWSISEADVVQEVFGTTLKDVAALDCVLFDINPAARVGREGEMIASGRLDNLVSCWAAIEAMAGHVTETPLIVCLFDHEEVGSESTTGAGGPLLESIIDELLRSRNQQGRRFEFLRSSLCISADNAHALHPNYQERHDSNHAPLLNGGPAIKVNANQRYATSPRGEAIVRASAAEAGIPLQTFVSNNAMPCGSTIGPITATRLGIETIDMGVPQLAMHSARETCGADDPLRLCELMVRVAATRVVRRSRL